MLNGKIVIPERKPGYEARIHCRELPKGPFLSEFSPDTIAGNPYYFECPYASFIKVN